MKIKSGESKLKAQQIGSQGSVFQDQNNNIGIGKNTYKSGASVYNYVVGDYASLYFQSQGQHQWYTAPSGTAGNAITWTTAMTLDASSNLTVSGTITESSDKRLKENINSLENSLEKVLNLNGVSYNKIATPEKSEIGFIAQEVEEVIPELVETDEDGMKSVSYARTVALLVEAMKDQQNIINSLNERIKLLEGRN